MTDTTNAIPEDVMKVAQSVVRITKSIHMSPSFAEEIVARAIMAERERTAARLDRLEAAEAERDAARALLKRAGEALSFYADTSKYPAPLTGGMGDLWSDCGQIAMAAATEIEETLNDRS